MNKQHKNYENFNYGSGMNFIIIDKPCNHSKLQCQFFKRSNILINFLPENNLKEQFTF